VSCSATLANEAAEWSTNGSTQPCFAELLPGGNVTLAEIA
jgi:hypothetical protein